MQPKSTNNELPEAFIERLNRILSKETFDEAMSSFLKPQSVVIRTNTLRADAPLVTKALTENGFRYDAVSWYRGAFVLQGCTASDITATALYKEGRVYIQSLSSLIPTFLLDPKPAEMVCDLCAAPGSKTTQMACMMKNAGTLIAVDNNKKRFYKLKANLSNQGATMVRAYLMDGEAVGRKYPERFDRILLDAPCSAEGRFKLSDPKTFSYWSPRKIKEMVRKQKRLLIAAFRALKPGGVLVYSTCTFAPEENEGVLSWFIEKVEEAILPEPIRLPMSNITQALSEWKGKVFHPSIKDAVRILPSELMEGFFVIKLRKVTTKKGDSPHFLSPISI